MPVCAGNKRVVVKREEVSLNLLSLSEVHLVQYKILHICLVPLGRRGTAFQTSAAVSGD